MKGIYCSHVDGKIIFFTEYNSNEMRWYWRANFFQFKKFIYFKENGVLV